MTQPSSSPDSGQIVSRDRRIAELEAQLGERDAARAELEAQLRERGAVIGVPQEQVGKKLVIAAGYIQPWERQSTQ